MCNWHVRRKHLMELHTRIPAIKPCVTDVLCNWEINSQMLKMCVIILGPIVSADGQGVCNCGPWSSRSLPTVFENFDGERCTYSGCIIWELVDPVDVADPNAQDNDKRNNIQVITGILYCQAVLQGVPFMGVQVLRSKRLVLLHERRARRTAKMK